MDVLVAGVRLGLTRREYQLLAALAERPDRVVSREELYELVWGGKMRQRDRSVDVFVRKLRTKLSAASSGWSYIHTRFGIGYRLSPEPILEPRTDLETQPARDPEGPQAGGRIRQAG